MTKEGVANGYSLLCVVGTTTSQERGKEGSVNCELSYHQMEDGSVRVDAKASGHHLKGGYCVRNPDHHHLHSVRCGRLFITTGQPARP